MLAQRGRQVGLGVVEQGSNIVVQRAFAPTLIVQKEWLAVAQHHVARLEVAIEKRVAARGQEKPGQTAKIALQLLLVEGNSRQLEKVILEVVQVPRNRLAVKAGAWITDFVVQVPRSLDLEPRQVRHHLTVDRKSVV